MKVNQYVSCLNTNFAINHTIIPQSNSENPARELTGWSGSSFFSCPLSSTFVWHRSYWLAMQQRAFGHMRTAMPRSACVSAKRIIGYYRMYNWRTKTRMILTVCAGWSKSLDFAHVRRYYFVWRDPYGSFQKKKKTQLMSLWCRRWQGQNTFQCNLTAHAWSFWIWRRCDTIHEYEYNHNDLYCHCSTYSLSNYDSRSNIQ